MAKAVPVRLRPSAPSSASSGPRPRGTRPPFRPLLVDIAQIVNPRHSSTVFASAGTGKTWLLVARILRLLLGGAPPESILAITFTRKAAAEIQERLTEVMAEWLQLDDDALAENLKHYQVEHPDQQQEAARALFETVQFAEQGLRVMTFDALFQDLLQRFPLEAGIPVGFTIPSEEEVSRLHLEAIDLLYQVATSDQDDAPERLAHSLHKLENYILSPDGLRQLFNSFQMRELEWRAFKNGRELPHLQQMLHDEVFEVDDCKPEVPFDFDADTAKLKRIAEILPRMAPENPSPKNSLLRAADKLSTALDTADPDPHVRLMQIHEALFASEGNHLRGSFWPLKDTHKERLSLADAKTFKELLTQLEGPIVQTIEWHRRQRACDLNAHWYVVGDRLTGIYQALKRDRGLMDFDDLRWHARELMQSEHGSEWVQYKLGQRFRHVLVDEFQDTDALSWQILSPFLDAISATETNQGSAFIVGDTKQSIYQWRRANPELQSAAEQHLNQNLAAQTHSMDTSRRSAPAVIKFVNACFLTRPDLAHFKPHDTHESQLWGQVELLPAIEKEGRDTSVSEDLRNPLVTARAETSPRHIQTMSNRIGDRIKELVGSDIPIQLRGQPARTPIYGDIMILVRRRTHVGDIEQALVERAIPFTRQARETLFDYLEIQDMQALLEVLLNPAEDLSLVQVLRSPMYRVSDEELMRLAQIPSPSHWSDRIASNQFPEEHPIRQAAADLARWRAEVDHLPLHDLLDRIYFESDALNRYRQALSPERGDQAAGNLIRFLELTLEFEGGRFPSTPSFVQYVRDMRERLIRASDAPDLVSAHNQDAGNRVQILTIHAAKGLEKPIVFCAEFSKSTSRNQIGEPLINWPSEAERPEKFLMRLRKEDVDEVTGQTQDHLTAMREKEKANVEYVSYTRAQQMLVICVPKDEHTRLANCLAECGGEQIDDCWVLQSGERPSRAHPPAPERKRPECADLDRPLKLEGVHSPSELSAAKPHPRGDSMAHRRARNRGSAIHALIKRLIEGTPSAVELERLARRYQHRPDDTEFQDWLAEAQELVTNPSLVEVFHPQGDMQAYTEVPISYWIADQEHIGVMDRLLRSPTQAWIIDFKSDRTQDPKQLRAVATSYQAQMQEYARYVQAAYPGIEVRCSVLFTRSQQLYDVRVDTTPC